MIVTLLCLVGFTIISVTDAEWTAAEFPAEKLYQRLQLIPEDFSSAKRCATFWLDLENIFYRKPEIHTKRIYVTQADPILFEEVEKLLTAEKDKLLAEYLKMCRDLIVNVRIQNWGPNIGTTTPFVPRQDVNSKSRDLEEQMKMLRDKNEKFAYQAIKRIHELSTKLQKNTADLASEIERRKKLSEHLRVIKIHSDKALEALPKFESYLEA